MDFIYGKFVRLAALAAFCLAAPDSFGAVVKWIYPPQNSVVTSSPCTIRGFVSPGLPANPKASVRQPGKPDSAREIPVALEGGQIFTISAPLAPGRNNIILDDAVLSVYYHADPSVEVPAKEAATFQPALMHKPAAEGCVSCHWVFEKELTLNEAMPKLCVRCHPNVKGLTQKPGSASHHEKHLTGYCVACHNPHASFSPKLVKEKGNACVSCHTALKDDKGHSKSAAQPCTVCHDPHGGDDPPMLKAPKERLCATCHEKEAKPALSKASAHQPVVKETCYTCHLPHSAGFPAQLKKEPGRLCLDCHPAMPMSAHKKDVGDCLVCHEAHAADNRRLLKTGIGEFCMKCHDKVYVEGKGHKVPQKIECFQCHSPHGTIMGKKISVTCGLCHQTGSEAFGIAHSKMPFETVRQCVSCHDMHPAQSEARSRALIYGPLHYPLKNGGCEVCHVVKNGKIEMKHEGSQNCIRCHGQTVGTSAANDPENIHAPIRQDDCIACHSPHFKNHPFMLLDEPDKVCEFCHGALTRLGNVRHKALDTETGCRRCHVPHFSDKKPLLKTAQPGICIDCHPKAAPAKDDPLAHGALKDDHCSKCHNPHSSEDKALIKDDRGELCVSCHQEVLRDKNGKPLAKLHGPVGANRCTACHYMGHRHKTQGDRFLLENPPWTICQTCHEVTDQHIPSIYLFRLARNTNGCLGCHLPHGAASGFMLRE